MLNLVLEGHILMNLTLLFKTLVEHRIFEFLFFIFFQSTNFLFKKEWFLFWDNNFSLHYEYN
jgi:hypothetical protein